MLELQTEQVPGSLPSLIADLSGDRAAIEQATGMVAAQLDANMFAAARRLREVAADRGRPLAEIAHDIVAGSSGWGEELWRARRTTAV